MVAMPRGEPKVMFAVRLPGELVEQVLDLARGTGVSKTEIAERALTAEIDRSALDRGHGDDD